MDRWPGRLNRRTAPDAPLMVDAHDLRAAPSTAAAPPDVVRSCARVGCSGAHAVACEYVDRRGSHCTIACCPAHQRPARGRPYCSRHGSVVRAVHGTALETTPLPDVTNRAASLVEFVADAVSGSMCIAVRSAWPGKLSLIAPTLGVGYPVARLAHRRREWTRTWKLQSHTGDVVAVTLAVAEDADNVLIVSVDSRTVAETVPPWIADRSIGADHPARRAFYDAVVECARAAVQESYEQTMHRTLRGTPAPGQSGGVRPAAKGCP